jgi:hypothetical protein
MGEKNKTYFILYLNPELNYTFLHSGQRSRSSIAIFCARFQICYAKMYLPDPDHLSALLPCS